MTSDDAQLIALREAVRALEDAGVAYALIGGLAVGVATGVPRATQDIDLAVPTTVARSSLLATLERAGFEHIGTHAHSINFRHRSGEPLQLAIDPEFDEMLARAEVVPFPPDVLRVMRKDDLIAMKERAASDPGRRKSKALRDRADLELLRGDVPDPDEGW